MQWFWIFFNCIGIYLGLPKYIHYNVRFVFNGLSYQMWLWCTTCTCFIQLTLQSSSSQQPLIQFGQLSHMICSKYIVTSIECYTNYLYYYELVAVVNNKMDSCIVCCNWLLVTFCWNCFTVFFVFLITAVYKLTKLVRA